MAVGANTKVQVEQVLIQPVRHTIAASRLLYTPPSFILRGPLWLMFIITFSAIGYSVWGRKDELVQAPMRLQRESTTIQSLGSGIVVDLPAQQNSYVKYNDLLVAVQEQTRLSSESERAAMQQKRSNLEQQLSKTQDEYENSIATLQRQIADYDVNSATQKTAAEGKIKQIEQQLAVARRTLAVQQDQLITLQKQFNRKKQLYSTHDITITEYEASQDQVFAQQKAVDDARSQIASIQVSLTTAQNELTQSAQLKSKEQLQAELAQQKQRRDRDVSQIQDQIKDINNRLEESKKLVAGVQFTENKTEYRSQFDGLITDVYVNKGQVIGAGAKLVTMVKESAPLEAQALVENKDIGHLKKGQPVKLKYFAYPYQEYGIQEGVIVEIAKKPSEEYQGKYPIRIALKKETIAKPGDRPKRLEIGLEGTAEIKTGEKRLIELVFSPLSKFFRAKDKGDETANSVY